MHARQVAEPLRLHPARPHHPFADRRARFARGRGREFGGRHGRHLHMQVDAVHERPRNPAHITVHRPRRTDALPRRMVVIPARTGVHRRHEDEVGGILHAVPRPRDDDPPLLERLPEHLEHAAPELGQLVQKQHPVVGQRHLARTGRLSAADERDLRREVVRRPEGPTRHQSARRGDLSRHGVYLGRLERLLGRERRQDRRQPPRQHRLSRAGRPDENDVVAARRSDLQRPLGMSLSLHVGEILAVTRPGERGVLPRCGTGRRDLRHAVQAVDHLAQRLRAEHLDALHHGRLGGVVRRQHDPPQPGVAGTDRQRQHAPHGLERPVERQLPDEHRIGHGAGRDALHRRENPHGDRQVEARTLLAQVGRRKVHDHLAARHALPGVPEGRPDALFALLHGVVGQPHEVHAQTAARDIDLDGDRHGVDSGNGSGIGANEHIRIVYALSRRNGTAPPGAENFRQNGASSSSERGVRSNSELPAEPSPPPKPVPGAPPNPVPGTEFEPLA